MCHVHLTHYSHHDVRPLVSLDPTINANNVVDPISLKPCDTCGTGRRQTFALPAKYTTLRSCRSHGCCLVSENTTPCNTNNAGVRGCRSWLFVTHAYARIQTLRLPGIPAGSANNGAWADENAPVFPALQFYSPDLQRFLGSRRMRIFQDRRCEFFRLARRFHNHKRNLVKLYARARNVVGRVRELLGSVQHGWENGYFMEQQGIQKEMDDIASEIRVELLPPLVQFIARAGKIFKAMSFVGADASRYIHLVLLRGGRIHMSEGDVSMAMDLLEASKIDQELPIMMDAKMLLGYLHEIASLHSIGGWMMLLQSGLDVRKRKRTDGNGTAGEEGEGDAGEFLTLPTLDSAGPGPGSKRLKVLP
jgi:hypothetical protein